MADYSQAEYGADTPHSTVSIGVFQQLTLAAGVRRLRELFASAPLSRLAGRARRHAMPPPYDEHTFRYLLDLEQKRSELANRPCFVMLIDFDRTAGGDAPLNHAAADQVFAIVAGCLRGSDVVGWYRRGTIAGAVLTQQRDVEGDDVSNLIAQRVATGLRRRLSADLARTVQLRVWRVQPGANFDNN
jgi:hypothetical protein